MKIPAFLIFALALPLFGLAQGEAPSVMSAKKHKVVFQLTSSDTLVHKALIKQLNNFLNAAPKSKLEVVCHNNGITFLQTGVTKQADAIRALKVRGVDFVACENTMRERKLTRANLVDECRTVPAGIVEIVLKQEKRWAYIRAGI